MSADRQPREVPAPAQLRAAAERLVAALAAHRDPEYRLTVLKRLSRRLGDDGYPLFLRLLGVVAESDDARAQELLADTLGAALRRMDLPGGALSSWGATRLPDDAGPLGASAFSGRFFGAAPQRLLGPIEYLAVWHLQRTQRSNLGGESFAASLARLIALLNRNEDARRLYPRKLAADARDEMEGTYTRATRECLATIAAAWDAGDAPETIARAAVDTHAAGSLPGWIVRDL